MMANTMANADRPEINKAIPNLDMVVGSFPFRRKKLKKGTKKSVRATINKGLID
jgi:hypothetical protein